MKNKTLRIIITIASILLIAGLGSVFVFLGNSWFNSLAKPSQWIPNFVIPIVWSIIYLAFGTILTIWQLNESLPLSTFVLLLINGALNVLWCLIFFTLNQTFLGVIIIILNLIVGFYLILDIMKHMKLYSFILAVYPIWLSIATCLNLAVWILN